MKPMEEIRTKRVTFTIPNFLIKELEKIASETGYKKSTIVQEGIKLFIEEYREKNNRDNYTSIVGFFDGKQ
jgi:metal-responsive CopG/Arc/MetJ family transcriptional regulator